MPFVEGDVVVKQTSQERWEIVEQLIYEGNEEAFIVQPGFSTDLASVPRVAVWLLPRYGKYTKAAILHDYLWHEARAGLFNKYDADGIFRRAMRELDVPFVRRWVMWAAVRLGSGRDAIRPGLGQFLLALLVAVPTLALILAPAAAILVALAIFWVVEALFFLVLRPFSARERGNGPQSVWKMS